MRRALAAFEAGDLREALSATQAALALDPEQADAHAMFGRIALALGQPSLALAPLERVARLAPSATTETALGQARHTLGETDAAGAHYRAALALDPDSAESHRGLGRLLQDSGDTASALPWLERAARLSSDSRHEADLSCAYDELGRFEDAHAAATRAVAADPANPVARTNLAYARSRLGQTREALADFDAALSLRPDLATALFGRACTLLRAGDWAEGWREYEWRWHRQRTTHEDIDVPPWRRLQPARDDIKAPLWRGEDLAGRRVLLHGEQGLGDVVQFARFASDLARRGAHVTLEAYPALLRLLATLEGVSAVRPPGAPVPPVDFHAPLGSLPGLLAVLPASLDGAPYLRVPADAEAEWRSREAAWARRSRPLIGLVWAGAARPRDRRLHPPDARRSIPLDGLRPLLAAGGMDFVSFQAGERAEDPDRLGIDLPHALTGIRDFADTAARLADIDLLITVDTAIAHVAGALGRPVWVLSRFDGCWRWLEGRADTPWYRSMRLFRQPAPGDWASVIAEVGEALTRV